MRKIKIINFIGDWLSFGKDTGYLFALKYKMGMAQEGIDFCSAGNEEVILGSETNS